MKQRNSFIIKCYGAIQDLAAIAVKVQVDVHVTNKSRIAVGVFFPPTDFLDYGGKMLDISPEDGIGRIVSALAFERGETLPTDADTITAAVKAISPAHLVRDNAPPFLLIHGDADPSVPLQQSEVMVAALKAKNIPAQLIIKPGGGHPWATIHEEVEVLADWFVERIVGEPKKATK